MSAVGFIYTIYQCSDAEKAVFTLGKTDVPRMETTYDIAYNAMAQTANIRAYFIYGNEQYKRVSALNAQLEAEMIKTARYGEGQRLTTELKALDDKYSEIAQKKVAPLIQAGKKDEAMQVLVNELAPAANELLAKVDEMKQFRKKVIAENADNAVSNTKRAQTAAIVAAVLAAVIGCALAVFAARRITIDTG